MLRSWPVPSATAWSLSKASTGMGSDGGGGHGGLSKLHYEGAARSQMVSWLPHINATLNAIALVLLLTGLWHIRHGREVSHRRTMLSAFAVSIAFLCCYLIYHAIVRHQTLPGSIQGIWRTAYYIMLASHIVLAALVPMLALATIFMGLRDRRIAHRRLARITFPIWVYVSITGILVYVVLY